MKLNRIFYLGLFFAGHCLKVGAQQPAYQHVIDSLNMRFSQAKHDSDRIMFRYLIGKESKVVRIGYWDSLLRDAHALRMPLYESRAYNQLAVIWNRPLDNPAMSISCSKRGLKIAEENDNKQEALTHISNLITRYQALSDARTALDFGFKGLAIAETLKDSLAIAKVNSRIAFTYYLNEEYEKSLSIHLKSLKIFRGLNEIAEIASELFDIGTIYQRINRDDKAAAYWLECGQYEEKFKGSIYSIDIYNAMGAAYQIRKQYTKADFYFSKAYRVADSLRYESGKAGVLASWSANSLFQGNLKLAKEQGLQALRIARAAGFMAQIPTIALNLSSVYEKEKNHTKALEYYKLYISSRDSFSNENNRKQVMEKQFAYNFEKKENENKFLAQQNQIQSLQLSKNRYFIVGLGGVVVLILVIGWLFIRQNKFRSAQKSMQLEQKLLRSQMNPHFIFNSLQAIQNFILKKDGKEAIKYLSSFAFITRTVLESSRMDHTSLKKELVLVENYLQLQKLRFGNSFEYTIHLDEQINAEEISIPPMLTQPFIENAVEHGMQGIEEGGKIAIVYTLKEHFLNIDITDNGWGMRYENTTGKKHKSLAMEITRERIALMNKEERRKTSFKITEAFLSPGERRGVKVTFSLPLQPYA